MKEKCKNMVTKILRLLPNKFLLSLKNFFEIRKGSYAELIEQIRLKKFVESTDFCKLYVNKWPICYIKKAAWDYPLFQMCFIVNMIDNIVYCLSKGYRPVVEFSNSKEPINLWEQFLKQPYDDAGSIAVEGNIECDVKDSLLCWPVVPRDEDIKTYAKLYKEFVRPNRKTQEYIDQEYYSILAGKRAIGVLCRGTDYTDNRPKGHPIQPSVEDVITLVREKKTELSCEYIYLATDEKRISDQFEREFPGRILVNKRNYYDEFYSIKSNVGEDARISMVHFGRERDSYYKSLEYFSSVMLLSKCTALIAGNCGGSRAALYLNDRQYEYWHLFDLGLY